MLQGRHNDGEIKSYRDAVFHVKRGFLIVGLTGYTGSGCTTLMRIFSGGKPQLPGEAPGIAPSEIARHRLIHKKLARVWETLPWQQFVPLEMSKVIFGLACVRAIADDADNAVLNAIRRAASEQPDALTALRYLCSADRPSEAQAADLVASYELCRHRLYARFKKELAGDLAEFVKTMQDLGDQIRRYGTVAPQPGNGPAPENLFVLPEAVRRLVQAYRDAKGCSHFVIDAFRNPYEVEFFKRRYSEFYLIGVLRDAAERREAVQASGAISNEALEALERRERGEGVDLNARTVSEWMTSQNVKECLRKADLYVDNARDPSKTYPHLRHCLVKLISLAKSPGCIPPTEDERNMQIAMVLKQMSGCISRRVGAVVVGKDGYVLGLGWNDPPGGQVPCSLRTGRELVDGPPEGMFSDYERSAGFVAYIQSHHYRDEPFCFREALTSVVGNGKKVEYTRALHAEENSFFQALRNGGRTFSEGALYTTARTCTLCAKKAYHLGISRIVYIDEYPDIAIEQTIRVGERQIDVKRFEGITGSAYMWLFEPLIPEKDFLQLYGQAYGHAEEGEEVDALSYG